MADVLRAIMYMDLLVKQNSNRVDYLNEVVDIYDVTALHVSQCTKKILDEGLRCEYAVALA